MISAALFPSSSYILIAELPKKTEINILHFVIFYSSLKLIPTLLLVKLFK